MKKTVSIILALLLAMSLIACSGKTASQSQTQSPTTDAPAASSAETKAPDTAKNSTPEKPEKLTILSVANTTGLWDFVKEWSEKTGIKVEINEMDLSTLQTQATTFFAAESPDIDLVYTYVALTAEWGNAGYLCDISDYLTASEWAEFSDGALNCVRYKGTPYGLPYFYSIRQFYCNMDLLNAAGFTEPPKDWDEFVKIATACTNPEKDQYGVLMGLASNDAVCLSYQDICALENQTLVDKEDKILFNNQYGVDALEKFVQLQTSGILDPASYGVSTGGERRARFETGNVAMAWEWAAMMPEIEAQGKFKAMISVTPAIVTSGAITGSEGLALSAFSKNKYWAMDLLKYLTSDEVQGKYAKISGFFPVKTTVFNDPAVLALSQAMEGANKQAQFPTYRWAAPYYSEAITSLGTHLFAALNGTETPTDALNGAASEVETIIQSYK